MDSMRAVEKRAALGQKGFTLIEIIAVLVIMGVLAAVAVPKYFDLTTEAEDQAIKAAVAQMNSNLSVCWAKRQLDSTATCSLTDPEIGTDFTYPAGSSGNVSRTAGSRQCAVTWSAESGQPPYYTVGACSDI